MQDLMQSATYRELAEMEQRKGEIKGEIKGKQEDIIMLLRLRFGDIPQNLQQRVQEISSREVLNQLLELAVKSDSAEEFEQKAKI